MVKLVALKSHTPDGSRRYRKGDKYEISESSANLLIQTGMAQLDTATRDMKATESEPAAKPQKGRYDRRDMRAKP